MLSRVPPSTAIAVDRPPAIGPVVVSVPHAGRIYPPEILAAARVGKGDLERLEDSWCDLIARGAVDAGATIVQGLWARAVADCNRGEGQMAPGEVAMPLRAQFSAPGRKERAGLGVGFEREVQALGLVEQVLFEQAVEHRAQPGGAAHAALGQRDAVPREGGGRNAEHDFAARGQERQQRAALVAQRNAVVACLGPVELARGVGRGEGGKEQQGGHVDVGKPVDCRCLSDGGALFFR